MNYLSKGQYVVLQLNLLCEPTQERCDMKRQLAIGVGIMIVLTLLTVFGNIITEITDPLDRQLVGANEYVQNNRNHPGVPVGMITIESDSVKEMLLITKKLVNDLQERFAERGVVQSLFSQNDPLTYVWNAESIGYQHYVTLEMLEWSEADLVHRYEQWQKNERSIGAFACKANVSMYCTVVSVVGKEISEIELGWKVFSTITKWSLINAVFHYKQYDMLPVDQRYAEINGESVHIDLVGWPFIRLMITLVSEIDIYIIIPMVMVIFSAVIIVRPVLGSWRQTGVVIGIILFLLLFCRALIGLWAYMMEFYGWSYASGFHPLEDVFDIRERVVVIVLGMSFFVRRFLDFNQSLEEVYFSRWKGSSQTMIFVAMISIASFVSSGIIDLFAAEKLRAALQVSVIAAVATFVTLVIALVVLPVVYYPFSGEVVRVQKSGFFSRHLNNALQKSVSITIVWITHRTAVQVAMILLLVPVIGTAIGFSQGALVTEGKPIAYARGTWAYTHAQTRMNSDMNIGPTGYEIFVEADLYDPKALCDLEEYSTRIADQDEIFVLVNPLMTYVDYILENESRSLCSSVENRYDAQTYWEEVQEETDPYLFERNVVLSKRGDECTGVRIYLSGRQLTTNEIAHMRDALIILSRNLEYITVLNADKISEFVEVERHYTYKRIIEDVAISIAVVFLFAFVWFGTVDLRWRQRGCIFTSILRSAIVAVIMTVPFVFAQAGVFGYMMLSSMPYDIGTSAINDVAVSAAADLPAFPIQTFLGLLASGAVLSFAHVMRSDVMCEELRRTMIDAMVNGSQFLLLTIFASIGAIERFGGLLTLTMALCVFAVFLISLPLLRFVYK